MYPGSYGWYNPADYRAENYNARHERAYPGEFGRGNDYEQWKSPYYGREHQNQPPIYGDSFLHGSIYPNYGQNGLYGMFPPNPYIQNPYHHEMRRWNTNPHYFDPHYPNYHQGTYTNPHIQSIPLPVFHNAPQPHNPYFHQVPPHPNQGHSLPHMQHTQNHPGIAAGSVNGAKENTLHSNAVPQKMKTQVQTMDDSSNDWPNGNQIREAVKGREPPKWNHSKWVWRSCGTSDCDGVNAEMRLCQGVYICSNPTCRRPVRPKTQAPRRNTGTLGLCILCKSPLEHQGKDCPARTYHYGILRDNVAYLVYVHKGFHTHDRPPGGRISKVEEDAVDEQVLRNFDASAHALRTGDTGPGSVPLPQIAPILAKPSAARYQIRQSQTRLGFAPSTGAKGAFEILRQLNELKNDFKKDFLIDSSVHNPTVLVFQTPFMQRVLEESIDSWDADDKAKISPDARHGLVMDGDHSYFREGVLLVTCVFNDTMRAWVPVLYSWILRQNEEHHRPHFRHVLQRIVDYVMRKELKFHNKYLLTIMDFSQAQRGAHEQEYAEAIIRMIPGFASLQPESQEHERKAYIAQAKEAERGCEFHFEHSAERIEENAAIIPQDMRIEFRRNKRLLLGRGTTSEQFVSAVKHLRETFPNLENWLSWWLRPANAQMIFPAVMSIDSDVLAQIPNTSNPSEHQHSLLHHAVGTDHDLIAGIKKIFLHVEELEAQYTAIKGGHFNPAPPRKYRPPTQKKWEENDGRAPDTTAVLLPPAALESHNAHYLVSYKWRSPNSCFFDSVLEILFRCYCSWSVKSRTAFLSGVPKKTFLAIMVFHFDTRYHQIFRKKNKKNTTVATTVRRHLELMQTNALSHIFDKWKLYSHGEHGCAMTWLNHAIWDGNPSREIQSHFAISHTVTRKCSNGHLTSSSIPEKLQVWFTTHWGDKSIAQHFSGSLGTGCTVTLTEYFAHHIPRCSGGNDQGTRALNTLEPEPCSNSFCDANSAVTYVATSWPLILGIVSDARRDIGPPDPRTELVRIDFENTFTVPDADGSSVTYELVGRVIHSSNHFTSQLRFGGQTYNYNDMENGGNLIQASERHLEKTDPNAVCYFYQRTSMKQITTRTVEDINEDYKLLTPLAPISVDGSLQSTSPHIIEAVLRTDSSPSDSEYKPSPSPPRNLHPVHMLPNIQEYIPDPYTPCTSCMLKDAPDEQLALCTMCETYWHQSCVQSTLPDIYQKDSDDWCCPRCINTPNGRWDKEMTGRFILQQISPGSRLYPAEILGRSSTNAVHIRWYSGNIYHSEKPTAEVEIRTPQECYFAKCDRSVRHKTEFGTIQWPVYLLPEVQDDLGQDDLGYSNTYLEDALGIAYHPIREILTGTREHPIIQLYQNHLSHISASRSMKTEQYVYEFSHKFHLPVFPADKSLLNPLLYRLSMDTRESDLFEDYDVQILGQILFCVVIMRTYLGRSPSDDAQIFYLSWVDASAMLLPSDPVYHEASIGSLIRDMTPPERVMSDCTTASSTVMISHGRYGFGPQIKLDKDSLDAAGTEELYQLFRACDSTGKPYQFFNTNNTGLSFMNTHQMQQPFSYLDSEPKMRIIKLAPLANVFEEDSGRSILPNTKIVESLDSEPESTVIKNSTKRKQDDVDWTPKNTGSKRDKKVPTNLPLRRSTRIPTRKVL